MKQLLVLLLLVCAASAQAAGQSDSIPVTPDGRALGERTVHTGQMTQPTQFDPNFHIYLCFGQSNMEGAARIEPLDLQWVDPRFRMLAVVDQPRHQRKALQWYVAYPPLCRDYTGLTPADYFGRTLVRQLPDSIKIGVVHVAVGGASIDLYDETLVDDYIARSADWFKNFCADYQNNPYRRLVEAATEAKKVGVIKGILLHQGCTDNGNHTWPARVKTVYNRLLKELDLQAADVPLIVGELGQKDQGGVCWHHNAIIDALPQTIPTAHVVSSQGLPMQRDGLHFTADGYRIFGQRYADTVLKLNQK